VNVRKKIGIREAWDMIGEARRLTLSLSTLIIAIVVIAGAVKYGVTVSDAHTITIVDQ